MAPVRVVVCPERQSKQRARFHGDLCGLCVHPSAFCVFNVSFSTKRCVRDRAARMALTRSTRGTIATQHASRYFHRSYAPEGGIECTKPSHAPAPTSPS